MVSVAADIDLDQDRDLIERLQSQRVQLTKYSVHNEFATNVDNEACVIAIVDRDNTTRFRAVYSRNSEGLISLLMDIIQVTWVKGFKIPA